MAGVMTSCLPVICITSTPKELSGSRRELCTGTTGSKETFALVSRGDVLFGPVLGHSPSSNQNLLISQPRGDLFVFEGPLRILLGDHFANHFSNGYRRQHVHRLISPLEPCVKKELQFEHSLRAMHVLISRDPTDRGFVHANILCHLLQHERFQALNSVLEELLLKLDDT